MKVEFSTEIQILKKTQIGMKNSISSTKRLSGKHKPEKRHVEDIRSWRKAEELTHSVKENGKQPQKWNIGDLWDIMAKSTYHWDRRVTYQMQRKYFQQNRRRKFPKFKKRCGMCMYDVCMYMYIIYIYISPRSTQYTGLEKNPLCIAIKTVNI